MDCTLSNFEQVLQTLQQQIPTASFIAIDGEFTGIHQNDEHRVNEIDTLEERYHKVVVSAQSFDMIQFGLCLFHMQQQEGEEKVDNEQTHGDASIEITDATTGQVDDGDDDDENNNDSNDDDDEPAAVVRLIARPYNFYLFKRNDTKHTFACQASSIAFLAENGMDFNKVFAEGISFCNGEELKRYEEYQKQMEERFKKQSTSASANNNKIDVSALLPRESTMLKSVLDRVREWLEHSADETLDLNFINPPCNSYQRRLLFQEVGSEFEGKVAMKSIKVQGGEPFIRVIRTGSEEQLLKVEEEKRKETQRRIDEYAGFRRVVELLLQHKKPLVGHNVMLDLVHLFDKCVNPLPRDVSEFKLAAHEAFPCIIDTKYLASEYSQLRQMFGYNTNLMALLKSTDPDSANEFHNCPTVQLAEGFESVEQAALHNAAYDAYQTGIIFARLSHFIGNNRSKLYDGRSIASPQHMQELVNKVYLMVSDVSFDLTDTTNVEQDRSNVFLLTNMSESTTNKDIYAIFAPYGQVKTVWISGDCCFVRVRDKEKAEKAKAELVHRGDLGFTIMTYDQARDGMVIKHLQSRYEPISPRSRKRARLPDLTDGKSSGSGNIGTRKKRRKSECTVM